MCLTLILHLNFLGIGFKYGYSHEQNVAYKYRKDSNDHTEVRHDDTADSNPAPSGETKRDLGIVKRKSCHGDRYRQESRAWKGVYDFGLRS